MELEVKGTGGRGCFATARMAIAALLAIICLSPAPVHAAAGDRHAVVYAKELLVREGPGKDFDSIGGLPRGHVVTEVARDGKWVQIEPDAALGIAGGWVFGTFLEPAGSGGDSATTSSSGDAFKRFKKQFDDVMKRFEERTGRTLFSEARDEGDGVLRLVGTDYWKVGSAADRESDVKALLGMWKKANNDLSVAVVVFDARGEKQLTMFE